MADAWWAVARSEEVTSAKPINVDIGDQPIVLWRDNQGVVRALEDRCPHRRAPLSLGCVLDNGMMQCGYHGWTFDGATGHLEDIPNLKSKAKFPAIYRAAAFAVAENGGFVRVCLDGKTAAPAPLDETLPLTGSVDVALEHEHYIAALFDNPALLIAIRGVRFTPYLMAELAEQDGKLVLERSCQWAGLHWPSPFSSDFPITLRISTDPITGESDLLLRDDAFNPLLHATLAPVPAGRGVTQVRWRAKLQATRPGIMAKWMGTGSPFTVLPSIDGAALRVLEAFRIDLTQLPCERQLQQPHRKLVPPEYLAENLEETIMLDIKDTGPSATGPADDYVDPVTADPQAFAAKVNAWVPHDIVLKDAWFPLAHSFAVTTKPVRRAVYSQPYFLWREGNTAVAAEFHPAEGQAGSKTAYSDAAGRYPVIEKYGYVWCWFGNPANAAPEHVPSLPYLPEDGGLPLHMLGTVRFDCTAPLSLENLIDLTHADFLHADVVGDEKMDKETVEVFHDSETITMVRTCVNKSVAPVMKRFGGVTADVQQVRQVIRIYLRSHAAIAYGRFSPGDNVQLFHPCVPETRDRTRLDYAMNTSNVKKSNPFRYIMPKASYKVSRQDSYMTSPQSPRYMYAEKRKDLHSPLDEAGQKYRVLMQALAERQAWGDFAYRDNVSTDCSEMIGYQKP